MKWSLSFLFNFGSPVDSNMSLAKVWTPLWKKISSKLFILKPTLDVLGHPLPLDEVYKLIKSNYIGTWYVLHQQCFSFLFSLIPTSTQSWIIIFSFMYIYFLMLWKF